MIGYLTVELAAKMLDRGKLPVMYDTGCIFYNRENMDKEEIVRLLNN